MCPNVNFALITFIMYSYLLDSLNEEKVLLIRTTFMLLRNGSIRRISWILNQITKLTMDNNTKPMTTFVSRTSPVTGKVEWIPQDENYDYIQEIAR